MLTFESKVNSLVYLDNNVLVDIEYGKCRVSDFISKPYVAYYYSDAHLNELLEAVGNPKVSHGGRLRLIGEICGHNLILSGGYDQPVFYRKSPNEMYRLVATPMIRMNRNLHPLFSTCCFFCRWRTCVNCNELIIS